MAFNGSSGSVDFSCRSTDELWPASVASAVFEGYVGELHSSRRRGRLRVSHTRPRVHQGQQQSSSSSLSSLTPSSLTSSSIDQAKRYGFGFCTPDSLQRLGGARAFLAFMCWFALVQSFPVNGLLNVNTATLQRRFGLSSSQLGWLSATYDIVGGLMVMPISYLGSRGHKPRQLAFGALLIAVGSVAMLSPHLLVGFYSYGGGLGTAAETIGGGGEATGAGTAADEECSPSSVQQRLREACLAAGAAATVNGTSGSGAVLLPQDSFYILLVGQALLGCGGLVLYTLWPVLIDEAVDRRSSPAYMGIFYAAASLAAAAGFLAGSRFLTIYVDEPLIAAPASLSQDDPEWVGAWWMGYALNACLAAPLVVLLFGVPRELIGADKADVMEHVCEAHRGGGAAAKPSPPAASPVDITGASEHGEVSDGGGEAVATVSAEPANLPRAIVALFRNPTFVCLTASGVCDSLFKSGVSQFLAQYIENRFNQTSSWAALLSGFVLVPGAVGGSFLGGWLPKKYGLRVRGLIITCAVASAVVLLVGPGFLMSCSAPLADLATDSGADRIGSFNLTQACNAPCACGTESYRPVCGEDGLQYFSACHAGCIASTTTNGTVTFHDCACVTGNVTSRSAAAAASINAAAKPSRHLSAVEGKCALECPLLYAFMVIIFVGVFASFVKLSPWTAVTLRIVKEDMRAYAIGLQAVFIRLLGIAPGPVIFGVLIDSTCLVWQRPLCTSITAAGFASSADQRGSCWIYEGDSLSRGLVACVVTLKVVSLALDLLALKLYRPPPRDPGAAQRFAPEAEERVAKAELGDEKRRSSEIEVADRCCGDASSDAAAAADSAAVGAEYNVVYDDRGLVGDTACAAHRGAGHDEHLHAS